MAVYILENTVQKYEWGSNDFLPGLLGKENPEGAPWAELWMGAHPKAPSIATDPSSGSSIALDKLIATDPVATMGVSVAGRFGSTLPFLFKVLSAAKPLSIQAHPAKHKAERGFEREEFAGVPIDAPDRNYKDPNHKPETVVALTPFKGMCGFRPIDEIIENVRTLSPSSWSSIAGRLAEAPGQLELSVFFYKFISISGDMKTESLSKTKVRSQRIISAEGKDSHKGKIFSWVLKLMDAFPGDIGALAPLVLNLFELSPGQAINLSAGQAHAYLEGSAVEIMANSDNVLRGGLTNKHIDIPELLSVLAFESKDIEPILPEDNEDGFSRYQCAVPDYSIAKATIHGSLSISGRPSVPEILLCSSGSPVLLLENGKKIPLPRGTSVFITGDHGNYTLLGDGEVFKASIPV
jgi:mannose-6-phosphate isomerase